MKLYLKFFLLILLIFDNKIISQPATYASFSPISRDSLKKHITYLGSDSLAGRGTGTRGSALAAQYIADHLKKYNIQPLGDNGTYFQNIPMHGSIPLSESRLLLFSEGKSQKLELGKDYLLFKSGAQTFIPQPVPAVFVGYGIIAPEFDYNDYQNLDVSGKIVVLLSGEPVSTDPTYFDGVNPSIYSHPESKQRIAISRGALGSIIVPNPNQSTKDWEEWQQEFAFEDINLAYSVTGQLSVLLNPQKAHLLFQNSPVSFNKLIQKEASHSLKSFNLPIKFSFWGKFISRDFMEKNVVGLLEGIDPLLKNSYVLLSAHFDHLGIGLEIKGDSIYNGVFDNAIGDAALLEIARAMYNSPEKLKRSVIFLFVTGEEKGLLGSIYYTDHPLRPLYKTIANINIDGIAMFDTFNDIVGIGAELSSLGSMLEDVSAKMELSVTRTYLEFFGEEAFYRSDQIAFAQAGIPSILILEGIRYKHLKFEEGIKLQQDWYKNIYHSPFDDLNQPMNFDAALQHCNLILSFCRYLCNQSVEPQWKPRTYYINARFQSIAEKR